jgi:transposase
LRTQLEPLTDSKLIQACAALDSDADLSALEAAMRHVLSSLARQWLQLHEEITVHSRRLKTLTRAAAPQLLELVGVGCDIAAEMLVTARGRAGARSGKDFSRSSVRTWKCGGEGVQIGVHEDLRGST